MRYRSCLILCLIAAVLFMSHCSCLILCLIAAASFYASLQLSYLCLIAAVLFMPHCSCLILCLILCLIAVASFYALLHLLYFMPHCSCLIYASLHLPYFMPYCTCLILCLILPCNISASHSYFYPHTMTHCAVLCDKAGSASNFTYSGINTVARSSPDASFLMMSGLRLFVRIIGIPYLFTISAA